MQGEKFSESSESEMPESEHSELEAPESESSAPETSTPETSALPAFDSAEAEPIEAEVASGTDTDPQSPDEESPKQTTTVQTTTVQTALAQKVPARALSTRVRVWIAVSAVFALLVAVAGTGTTVGFFSVSVSAPKNVVSRYLHDLEQGKLQAAMKLSRSSYPVSGDLMTDAAYKQAADKISHFSLGGEVIHGNTLTVKTHIVQGTDSYDEEFQFTLSKGGNPVTGSWRFDAPQYQSIDVAITPFTSESQPVLGPIHGEINGVPITNTTFELAPPGRYSYALAAKSSSFVRASPQTADVVGFGHNTKDLSLSLSLTPLGVSAAKVAVAAYLVDCLSTTVEETEGCPFADSLPDGDTSVADFSWTLVTAPTPTISTTPDSNLPGASGWAVTSTTGYVNDEGIYTGSQSGDLVMTSPESFTIQGHVSFNDKGDLVYLSDYEGQSVITWP